MYVVRGIPQYSREFTKPSQRSDIEIQRIKIYSKKSGNHILLRYNYIRHFDLSLMLCCMIHDTFTQVYIHRIMIISSIESRIWLMLLQHISLVSFVVIFSAAFFFSWACALLIDREPHWYKRRVKEAIHIRLHPNNINQDSGIEIPKAWMPTIKKKNNNNTTTGELYGSWPPREQQSIGTARVEMHQSQLLKTNQSQRSSVLYKFTHNQST